MSGQGWSTERFWEAVCGLQRFWWMLAILNCLYLVLLAIAALFMLSTSVEPASVVVGLIAGAVSLVALVVLVFVLYRCNERRHGR